MRTPRRLLAIVVALAFLFAACGNDGNDDQAADEVAADQRQPVVVDTDMSIEGAMSILYLLQAPEVSVEAITISGTGLVSCDQGVDQALGLIALAGAQDIPVACGPSEPLAGENSFPPPFLASAASLSGVRLPHDSEPSELSAPELLASVIEESPAPVAIYADGPLTNIALLLEDFSGSLDNVAGITFMGGAVDVAGTVIDNPDAEWNVWIDPAAASQVLGADVPVTMVPLDATNAVPATLLHTEAMEQYQSTEIGEVVHQMMANASGIGAGFVYFWDQLNAAVLLDESLATFEERLITVVTDGAAADVGATVEDPEGDVLLVAVDANREAFESTFFTTLLGAPFEPVDLTPDITVSYDGEVWSHEAPAELSLGPVVLAFDNTSSQDAAVALIWLIGDATTEDLAAYESVEPPDWVGLAGFMFAPPGGSDTEVIELTEPGTNIIQSLRYNPDEVEPLGTFEVR